MKHLKPFIKSNSFIAVQVIIFVMCFLSIVGITYITGEYESRINWNIALAYVVFYFVTTVMRNHISEDTTDPSLLKNLPPDKKESIYRMLYWKNSRFEIPYNEAHLLITDGYLIPSETIHTENHNTSRIKGFIWSAKALEVEKELTNQHLHIKN